MEYTIYDINFKVGDPLTPMPHQKPSHVAQYTYTHTQQSRVLLRLPYPTWLHCEAIQVTIFRVVG